MAGAKLAIDAWVVEWYGMIRDGWDALDTRWMRVMIMTTDYD